MYFLCTLSQKATGGFTQVKQGNKPKKIEDKKSSKQGLQHKKQTHRTPG